MLRGCDRQSVSLRGGQDPSKMSIVVSFIVPWKGGETLISSRQVPPPANSTRDWEQVFSIRVSGGTLTK